LPILPYGCENCSVTLREEHRWRVFEVKGDEVTGSGRKVRNKELHNLYPSTDIIRMMKLKRMRWAGKMLTKRFCGKG
jgi:hypothetical protein